MEQYTHHDNIKTNTRFEETTRINLESLVRRIQNLEAALALETRQRRRLENEIANLRAALQSR